MTVNGLRRVFIVGESDVITETNDTYICERKQNGLQYIYSLTSNYIYSQRSADTISLQAPTAQELTLADSLQDKSDSRAIQEFKTYRNIINDFYNTYIYTQYVKPKTFAIYCQYLTVKCTGLSDTAASKKINVPCRSVERYKVMYGTMFYNFMKNK